MSSNNRDVTGDEGESGGVPNINGARSHANGTRALTNGLHIPDPEMLDESAYVRPSSEDDDESTDGDLPHANGGHGEIDGMNGHMDVDDEPSYYVVPDEERRRITAEIRDLYAIRGVPLWTRDAMRDLANQIDLHRDVLAIRGLDGTMHMIPFYADEGNLDGHMIPGAKPTIEYHSIEDLVYGDLKPWSSYCAYLTMTVTWHYYSTLGAGHANHLDVLEPAIEEVVERVNQGKENWKTTSFYGQMQTTVGSYPAFARVKKIVGIALGGLVYGLHYEDHEEGQEDAIQRSVLRYAFMLVLQELIAELPDFNPLKGPRCIVQDPALGLVDKEHFTTWGWRCWKTLMDSWSLTTSLSW
ncbi:hypothetical protein F5Y01DRAFT_319974 [Xylaria sp. FL0043]|nr:hypothetical protein F5Y01DRAFT_319974 [Xylaria sp. FL0043]